jgi:hypothetical protein
MEMVIADGCRLVGAPCTEHTAVTRREADKQRRGEVTVQYEALQREGGHKNNVVPQAASTDTISHDTPIMPL